MKDRIKYIRKDKNMTLEKFGEKIGVTKAAISNIERGTRNVTEQMIRSICREFQVNETWLRTGQGEPYTNALENAVQKFAADYDLREIEIIALTEYLKLDDSHRAAFRDYLFNVISAQKKVNHQQEQAVRLIHYYYRLASAGTGQLLLDNLPEKYVPIPDIPKYKKVNFAISVNGSSMEPLYHDGDMLLAEPADDIRIGQIGIFDIGGQCYVKERGKNCLVSLNPEYENIPLDETARTLGLVIDALPPGQNSIMP